MGCGSFSGQREVQAGPREVQARRPRAQTDVDEVASAQVLEDNASISTKATCEGLNVSILTKATCDVWEKFGSVRVEFIGMAGNSKVSSISAKAETTIGMLRNHVLSEVKGVHVELCSGATVLSSDERKLSDCAEPSVMGTIAINYIMRNGDPTDAEVMAEPERYNLCLSGHIRPDCNGVYTYNGKENGKDAWAKTGSKVFWTHWAGRGHTWDIYWGGISPENKSDTPIPPRSGWDGQGQAANTINISYVRV